MTTPPAPPAATGADAVKATAEGTASDAERANALEFFMGDAPPPNAAKTFRLKVDFGELGAPNLQECVFRTLDLEEMDKAEQLGLKAANEGKAGDLGAAFVRWSYVFAYSCETPDLSAALAHRKSKAKDKEERDRLTDTAALVREVFRRSAGPLSQACRAVERHSRLGQAGLEQIGVEEIEAGKDSS